LHAERQQKLLLRVDGVRELTCPRAHPWGPSVHINRASARRTAEGRECLELDWRHTRRAERAMLAEPVQPAPAT
jgi:hypothetical protein